MRTWVPKIAFHDQYLGYAVDVAAFGGDDDAVVGGTCAEDDIAVGDGDGAGDAADETLCLVCTCVDDAGTAVGGSEIAVGKEGDNHIADTAVAGDDYDGWNGRM